MQTIALRQHPLIEFLFRQLKAVEKVAAIDLARAHQRFFRSGREKRFELGDVGSNHRRVDAEEVGLLDENARVGRDLRELFSQRREKLAQTLARLFGTASAP